MEASAETRQLLDISTFAERDFVVIDGERFEIYNRGELGIVNSTKISLASERVAVLSVGDASLEQAQQARDSLEEMMRILFVDIPDEMLAKLDDEKRLLIVNAWVDKAQAEVKGESDPTKPRTGAKSSRGSKSSTDPATG